MNEIVNGTALALPEPTLEAKILAVEAAAAKRAADQAHRQRIRDDIATSMNGFTDELTAVLIADTLMDGGIPHCAVVIE